MTPEVKFSKGTIKSTIKAVVVLCIILWILSGTYVIKADEAGVVRRFGVVLPAPVTPGIHYHFPYPISKVTRLQVTQVSSLAVGFVAEGDGEGTPYVGQEKAEFLTGDENIIHCQAVVKWSISDPIAYVTSSADAKLLLRNLAEGALLFELGMTSVDDAFQKRGRILENVSARLAAPIQELNIGIGVVSVDLKQLAPPSSVANSFKEVASAREDAARLIHEAEGYQNEAMPKARADARQLRTSAQAYKEKMINQATGDADRFSLLYAEYKKNPSVTTQRLYLESMEQVLPRLQKYVLGTKAGERAAKVTMFMDEIRN